MNKKNLYSSVIVLTQALIMVGQETQSMTTEGVLNDISYAYQSAFESSHIQKVGIIRGITPSFFDWIAVEQTADTFIKQNALADKDLLDPWESIKKENNAIITTITEWQRLLNTQTYRADASVMRQSLEVLKRSVAIIDQARKQIKKTLFVRTSKKEAAKVLSHFADLLARVGDRAIRDLRIMQERTMIQDIQSVLQKAKEARNQ